MKKKIKGHVTIAISAFLAGLGFNFFLLELPLEANPQTIVSKEIAVIDSQDSSPIGSLTLKHSCYSLSYDCRTMNANWVYERITAKSLAGNADRNITSFKENPAIPELFRSTLSDYKGSGFDRGHLAPAANHKSDPIAMEETFYLSNMSPQVPELNREHWSKLERHVRDLTKTYAVVESYTGPLYLPQEDKNGLRWVKYQVIGKNDVAVPTHFYKVLVLESSLGKKEYKAFILPNKAIDSKTSLNSFAVTVQKVEKLAGLIFFPKFS